MEAEDVNELSCVAVACQSTDDALGGQSRDSSDCHAEGNRMDDLMVRHMSLLGFSTSARSNSVLLAPAAGLCFDTLFALACWILAALTYMWRPSFAPSFAAGFL